MAIEDRADQQAPDRRFRGGPCSPFGPGGALLILFVLRTFARF